MKFSKPSQLLLVSAIGLAMALSLTACQVITSDYLYVATSGGSGTGGTGQIETYAVDSASGAIHSVAAGVPSGGSSPVALAVTSDYLNLYVANQSGTIVHFAVAGNGELTQKDTVTASAAPVSLAVNAAGSYLYVVTSSGSGADTAVLTAYPLASGAIGTALAPQTLNLSSVSASYADDTILPTAVTVLANSNAVYVTAWDQSAYNPGCDTCVTSPAHSGWVFGFTVGSGGALAATPGSPYQAGVEPSAVTSDPTNPFVYVTDFATEQLIGYAIQDANALSFILSGPFATGLHPDGIAIDPSGKFIYVANALSNSVTADSIVASTGAATAVVNVTGSATNSTDAQPVAIIVEPALGRYVYTANKLGNSVSGFKMDPSAGSLSATQATPYPTGNQPTALVAVPHGNHAIEVVAP